MRFTLAAVLALPLLVSAAAPGNNKCNTGEVQCCNQVTTPKDAAQSDVTAGLIGALIGPITGPLVGLHCSPLSLVGVGGACQASAQAVCCENVHETGLVNVGCTPIDLKA
ncbi:fungal hydrophobin, partial [Schizophyllum commune H4-8]|uniref:Hydrophobin n=1 Tax=Schizophyllum commune (strain H4-8 / FGSC 9210) TaxID=578458 RepID=D8PU87_SCHCM